ncbi:hypothetical protein L1887_15784 [Cichorium endivia]|nr:hypothetical protein L1887_15784 [Cichorium endivia]
MSQPSAPIVSVSHPSAPYCQLYCSFVTPLFQRLSEAIPPPAPDSGLNGTPHLRSTAPSHPRSFFSGLLNFKDTSKQAIKVDFANKYFGGGALIRGRVHVCLFLIPHCYLQEEICLMIIPELVVEMLFLPCVAGITFFNRQSGVETTSVHFGHRPGLGSARVYSLCLERDGNPALASYSVMEGTPKVIFPILISIGSSRSQWDFCFQKGSVIENIDGHTNIIHKQLDGENISLLKNLQLLEFLDMVIKNGAFTIGGFLHLPRLDSTSTIATSSNFSSATFDQGSNFHAHDERWRLQEDDGLKAWSRHFQIQTRLQGFESNYNNGGVVLAESSDQHQFPFNGINPNQVQVSEE